MAAGEGGQNLVDLWKAVLKAHDQAVPAVVVQTADANAKDWSHLSGVGVDLLTGYARSESPKQNRAPQENDMIYLLDEIIKQRFPNGGVFRSSDPARYPDSTADLQAFFQFIETPEWRNHPCTPEW